MKGSPFRSASRVHRDQTAQPHFGVSELVLSLACCTFCCRLLPFIGVLSLSVSPFSLISPTQSPVIDTWHYSCWYFADVFCLLICILEFVIYFVINIDHIWSYQIFFVFFMWIFNKIHSCHHLPNSNIFSPNYQKLNLLGNNRGIKSINFLVLSLL